MVIQDLKRVSVYAIPGLKNKKNILKSIKKNFSAEDVERCVCEYFNLVKEKFISTSQKREFIYPRQIFMHICMKHTMLTLDAIGSTFPSKKSTDGIMNRHAVYHAKNTIQSLLSIDERVGIDINCVTDMLLQGIGSKTIKDVINVKS